MGIISFLFGGPSAKSSAAPTRDYAKEQAARERKSEHFRRWLSAKAEEYAGREAEYERWRKHKSRVNLYRSFESWVLELETQKGLAEMDADPERLEEIFVRHEKERYGEYP